MTAAYAVRPAADSPRADDHRFVRLGPSAARPHVVGVLLEVLDQSAATVAIELNDAGDRSTPSRVWNA